MRKTDKVNAKVLEKNAVRYIRNIVKDYNSKIKNKTIYRKCNDFFFRITIFSKYDEGSRKFFLYGTLSTKPYLLDDLFWDIFQIPDNKNQPESLRANGAYVAPNVDIGYIEIEISDEELEKICQEFLKEINNIIEKFLKFTPDIGTFSKDMKERKKYKCNELFLILLDIYEKKYQEALIRIDQELAAKRSGGFAAGDKNIYEFAREYCYKVLKNLK